MLLPKVDYFNLSSAGWEAESTSENKSVGYLATAQGPDGFPVAIDAGGEIQEPEVNYIATKDAVLSNIVLGDVKTINGKQYMLGSITINTNAGQYPTMTARGKQIENNGTAGCRCRLDNEISVSHLYHAQNFGMFEVTNGQLNSSTLTINSDVGTAMIDGVIKSSDLVGGSITVTGNVIGVNNYGEISQPSVSITLEESQSILSSCITQPLTQTNPNGDYPTYSFEIQYALKANYHA